MPAISLPMRHREDFQHDSEFRVYERLLYGLGDGWIIVPNLEMMLPNSFREREADLLLLHPDNGLVLIEVKSSFAIRHGEFYKVRDHQKLDKDPTRQLAEQRRALADALVHIDHNIYSKIRRVIATPSTVQVTGNLPPGYRPIQLLDSGKLANIPRWIEELCSIDREGMTLTPAVFTMILDTLCGDADFDNSAEGLRRVAHAQLEQRMAVETQVLESLDCNRRAIVTGGAGSGKTRLVLAWAQRALRRGERVLVTCYNDPLAGDLAEQLSYQEGALLVAPILRHLEEQVGKERREPDDGEDLTPYWEQLTEEIFASKGPFHQQFDTIVVDEAQDFDNRWLEVLERLLPNDGTGRILMVADPFQDVRGAGARLPTNDDGWAMARLESNYRNAPQIAAFMQRRFQGAGAAAGSFPLQEKIRRVRISDRSDMVTAVDHLLEGSQRGAEDIWVLTTSRHDRDHLRQSLGLRAWESPDHTVVCETVRRLKGLDAQEVILVSLQPVDDEEEHLRLLYAGVSRAIDALTIVGTDEVFRRLGI